MLTPIIIAIFVKFIEISGKTLKMSENGVFLMKIMHLLLFLIIIGDPIKHFDDPTQII